MRNYKLTDAHWKEFYQELDETPHLKPIQPVLEKAFEKGYAWGEGEFHVCSPGANPTEFLIQVNELLNMTTNANCAFVTKEGIVVPYMKGFGSWGRPMPAHIGKTLLGFKMKQIRKHHAFVGPDTRSVEQATKKVCGATDEMIVAIFELLRKRNERPTADPAWLPPRPSGPPLSGQNLQPSGLFARTYNGGPKSAFGTVTGRFSTGIQPYMFQSPKRTVRRSAQIQTVNVDVRNVDYKVIEDKLIGKRADILIVDDIINDVKSVEQQMMEKAIRETIRQIEESVFYPKRKK